MNTQTDEELVIQTREGDLSAFEKLVKRYQSSIYRHSVKILNDPDAAEDATQESFIRAFTHLDSFDQTKSFKTWIFSIATHYCYDYFKKNNRIVSLESPDTIIQESSSLFDQIFRSEQAKCLFNALKKLPQIYQSPIIGYYYHGYHYEAIARLEKVPINTVRTRMHRGKQLLAKLLEGRI